VKRKLVVSPSEYRWSSASGVFAMKECPQGFKPLRARAANRHG
jgi:hypothetical protein